MDSFILVMGVGDLAKRTACLMSYRAVLDGRGLTDEHPSAALRTFGIAVNDAAWWYSDVQRTGALLPIAADERLCALNVDASPEAEQRRAFILADWACRVVAPYALAKAGLYAEAQGLASLAPVTDESTAWAAARAARAAAMAARAAARVAWAAARAARGVGFNAQAVELQRQADAIRRQWPQPPREIANAYKQYALADGAEGGDVL